MHVCNLCAIIDIHVSAHMYIHTLTQYTHSRTHAHNTHTWTCRSTYLVVFRDLDGVNHGLGLRGTIFSLGLYMQDQTDALRTCGFRERLQHIHCRWCVCVCACVCFMRVCLCVQVRMRARVCFFVRICACVSMYLYL
jgi:hypothetical protein